MEINIVVDFVARQYLRIDHFVADVGQEYLRLLPIKMIDYSVFTVIASVALGWRTRRIKKATALKLAGTHRSYLAQIDELVKAMCSKDIEKYETLRGDIDRFLPLLDERRNNLLRYVTDDELPELKAYGDLASSLRRALRFKISAKMKDESADTESGSFDFSGMGVLTQSDRFCGVFSSEGSPTLILAQQMSTILKLSNVWFFRKAHSSVKEAALIDSSARDLAREIENAVGKAAPPNLSVISSASPNTVRPIASQGAVDQDIKDNRVA